MSNSYEMREWIILTQWSQLKKCSSCYNSFLMGCSFSSMLFCGIFLLFFSVLIIIVINFILTFFFLYKNVGTSEFWHIYFWAIISFKKIIELTLFELKLFFLYILRVLNAFAFGHCLARIHNWCYFSESTTCLIVSILVKSKTG